MESVEDEAVVEGFPRPRRVAEEEVEGTKTPRKEPLVIGSELMIASEPSESEISTMLVLLVRRLEVALEGASDD